MSPAGKRTELKVWIFTAFLMLASAVMASSAQADLSFQAAVSYGAGGNPQSVTTGDFNGDGFLDLAVANLSSHNVSILLGTGTSFTSAGAYGAGYNPSAVTAGDFNRDGKLDLAVTNIGDSNVSVLIGNGNGTFQGAVNYGAGYIPFSIATGDFNRDGKLDLAVTNAGNNNVSILLGNGNGTFQTAVNYTAGAYPCSIHTGDFDGDGAPDLAVANKDSNNVSVLLGNGDGTFEPAVNYGAGATPWSVVSRDFDGDGEPDLAVANGNSFNISILRGNGNGTFLTAVNYSTGSARSVTVGDFDGDGMLDLAVANYTTNNVSILLGNGDCTFQSAVNYLTGSAPISIVTGDFNRDAKPDLAVANYSGATASVLFNSGTFDPAGAFLPAVNYPAGTWPASVVAGDFNGDGILDLATANKDSNNVSIVLGHGDGTFQAAVNYGAGTGPRSITSGDFNGDGKLDLAVANRDSNNVSILMGNGTGAFTLSGSYGVGTGPYAIVADHLNRDGNLDLAVVNLYDNNVYILMGDGTGAFWYVGAYGVVSYPNSVATGDFNADGKLDLAVTNNGGYISILLGDGGGTFILAGNYINGATGPISIASGDFNGDGKADLVVANSNPANSVSILLGNGTGGFSSAGDYGVGSFPYSVAMGDFNRDGKLDVAVANYAGQSVSVLLGNGDGTLQGAVQYGVGSAAWSVTTGDFDGDGKLDLAAAIGSSTGNVSILLNTAYYTITASAGSNGSISPSGAVTVLSGYNQTFTITPDAGYAVADVLVDGISQGAISTYPFNNVIADHTISASFIITYTLTATAGAHGTISPSGAVTVVSGGSRAFTITPGACYHVADVLVDGSSVGAVMDYTFDNVTSNHTISASFALDTKTITATAGVNGTISPSGAVPVNCGSSQGFTITPSSDYYVSDILVDDVSVGAAMSYSFNNVTADHTISPVFSLGHGISGNIRLADSGLGGVVVNLTGASTATTTTSASGDFAFRGLANGSYAITPILNTYTFAPPYRNIAVAGSDAGGQDFTGSLINPSSFEPAVNPAVGTRPYSVTAGDFNGDGKIDLAVANAVTNNVSVLLGNGNGTFQAAVNYATGSNPWGVTTGDFNGDGRLDLAVANTSGASVSILLGNGNGTFQAGTGYGTGSGPYSLIAGDLNNDGKLDLAVTNRFSNSISILLGNGNGTLQATVNYAVGSTPSSVIKSDLNNDGKLDLAVANAGSNNISVLLGNGNGTFQAPVNYAVGSYPLGVAAGDFNGDGKTDLAGIDYGSGQLSILMGNGNGTFQAAVNYAVGSAPWGVSAKDFNGDGKTDLAVTIYNSNQLSILLGNGNGTFQSAVNYGTGNGPDSLISDDFNHDGKPDVAVANYGGNTVSILLNSSTFDPASGFAPAVNHGTGGSPRWVSIGDFNRDGKPDLVVVNFSDVTISTLLGDGAGAFAQTGNYGMIGYPNHAVAGDFNGDGKPDLAVAGAYRPGINYVGYVSILLGNSDGTFQTPVNYNAGSSAWSNAFSVTTGDFNRDGKLDLAVANLLDSYVSLLLGNGDGTFQTPLHYWSGGSRPYSVVCGDFNGDGNLDVASANLYSANTSILLGNGNGTFQAAVTYAVGTYPYAVATSDFNLDGKLDLAVANYGSNNVSILVGNGDGTFQGTASDAVGSYPISVTVCDVNRDGKPDLAVANGGSNTVSILMGNGDGTFQAAVNHGVGSYPYAVAAGDLNLDGKPDLVTANQSSNTFSVLTNIAIYTITASAGANGAISPSGAVTVNHGSNQSFTITPDTGYQVADVLVDGASVGAINSYQFNSVIADHTLSASFAINSYTINATAGANGSISPSGAVAVNHGSNQSFAITSNTNYHVADVLVDGSSVGAVTSYEFTNVTTSHTISTSFAINTYTLTATAGANGNILPSGTVTVSHGGNQSYTISPDADYHIADVWVDGVSQGPISSYEFINVTSDHTISAGFAVDTYTITAIAGANGSITPSGAVSVNHGSAQSFAIAPDTGYHVDDVRVDGVSQGALSEYSFSHVTADHTISASFTINTYTITASAGANGSVTPSGAVSVSHGSDQSFAMTPDTGYHVDDVWVDGSSVGAVTSHQFNNVTASHTISASFMATTGATTPTGRTDAGTGYVYTYTTSGSPGDGDPAEYQFDWKGDESDLSPWGSSTQTKSWPSVGTYTVRARARCAVHTSIVSDWSSGLRVIVVDPNFVDFSINDGAPITSSSSVTLTYITTGNPRFIRVFTGAEWRNWQDLSSIALPHTISLGTANGLREVFAQVKDDQGRVSPVARGSIILDTTAPKGVIKINGGNTVAASGGVDGTPVRLHLAMLDANMTGAQMRMKNDGPFVNPDDDDLWEGFTTGKDVTLTAGVGTRKVYVQFKDGAGNLSPVYSPSIKVAATGGLPWPGVSGMTVDSLQLSGGAGTVYSTDTDVILSCSLADYAGLSVRYLSTTVLGTVWTNWKPVTGNEISKPLALSSTNGLRQVYVQFMETSSGQMTDPQEATIILDTRKPAGIVRINNGVPSVLQNTAGVTLAIAAKDCGSGIDKMAIYQTGDILPSPIKPDDPRFQDFAPNVVEYALNTSTLGTKTVYVWVKDKAGKISAVMKDTINVVAP